MLFRSHEFPGVNWLLVDPGLTETGMTRNYNPTGVEKKTADQTAKSLLDLTAASDLMFVDSKGNKIPW